MSQIKPNPSIHQRKFVQANNPDKYRNVPKPYMKVAEGMEEQFTKHLLTQMRKSVDSARPDTQAEKIYKSLQDDQRAKLMASSDSGLGVKDMVLDNLLPHWRKTPGPQKEAINSYNQVKLHNKGAQNE